MYQLELKSDKKRIFVTQLQDDEDIDEEDVEKIPIVKHRAGKLIEYGYRTLQSTLLLKRKHEAAVLNVEYEQEKNKIYKRIEICKERDKVLKERENKLKLHKLKFSKFIDENNKKKQRALEKFQDEELDKISCIEKLAHLKSEEEYFEKRRLLLLKKVQHYKKYEEYLIHVLDVLPEDYLELGENMIERLLKKYDSLHKSYEMLMKNIEENNTAISEYSLQLVDLSTNSSQQIAIYNKQVSTLSSQLSEMKVRNANIQSKIDSKIRGYRCHSEVMGGISLAIENLYQMCDNHGKNVFDLNEKLNKIQELFKERYFVLSMCTE